MTRKTILRSITYHMNGPFSGSISISTKIMHDVNVWNQFKILKRARVRNEMTGMGEGTTRTAKDTECLKSKSTLTGSTRGYATPYSSKWMTKIDWYIRTRLTKWYVKKRQRNCWWSSGYEVKLLSQMYGLKTLL